MSEITEGEPPTERLFCYADAGTPIVFGSFDREQLNRQISSLLGSFIVLEIDLGGETYYLALRKEFELLEGERQRRSPGSQARYLAQLDCGGYGFLIQLLEPGVCTSYHSHRRKEETFYRLVGEANIKDGKGEHKLTQGHFVPAGVFHQLRTDNAWVLTLIRIDGPGALTMTDYEYA